MFGNGLITAIRVLSKNTLFSVVNIGGLTIGLTAAFTILLFVISEISYDKWLPKSDRIYTIEAQYMPPSRAPKTLARTPLELRASMEKDFSEIKSFTRFYAGVAPVKRAERSFPEKALAIEETFFGVFELPFQEGSITTALASGQSVIISHRTKEKYFPDEQALGQVITIQEEDYSITGVLAPFPGKSHLDFEILIFDGPGALNIDFVDWTSARVYSYFKLQDGAQIQSLEARTESYLNQNAFFAPESWKEFTASEVMSLSYLPVTDIHLHQSGERPIKAGGSAKLVYGFLIVAAAILVMASINFIQLSMATASSRAKEIAIHKIVGARRLELIGKHILEALLLVAVAFMLALALTEIITPFVFNWVGVDGFTTVTLDFNFLIIAALASAIVSILAALYPAFYLSSLSPTQAFAGDSVQTHHGKRFRTGLIWVQYVVAMTLIVSSGHFYLQTRFSSEVDLGFNPENIVTFWGLSGAPNFESQRNLLEATRRVNGVVSATRITQLPGAGSQNNVSLKPLGGDTLVSNAPIQAISAGDGFDTTLEIKLIAGRAFDKNRPQDAMPANANVSDGTSEKSSANTNKAPASIILNELAVTSLGFSAPEQAIGKTFLMSDYLSQPIAVQVVGVTKNAHFQSIHSDMVPLLFTNLEPIFNGLVIKLDKNYRKETLIELETLWMRYIPEVPVFNSFLEDDLGNQYATEARLTQVFGIFTALAILVAFLGVFGLSAFNIARREKEMGIRKILGATVTDIVRLFTWQFSKPLVLATVVAWLVGGQIVQNWLEQFAYRIDLSPLVFASASGMVFGIVWLTVAIQSARAARKNPILAIRHE